MIEVRYWKDEKLKKWYAEEMLVALKALNGKSLIKKPSYPLLQPFYTRISALEETELADILLEDRNKLAEKYDWINEYIKLCDFTAYYSALQELTKEKRIYTPLRIKYLDQYRGYYLEALISELAIDEAVLTHSWPNFDKLHLAAQRCCQDLNLIIGEVLDYSFMPQQIRHQLYQKMDVQVCPYCNRQYIHTVSATEKETYLGDLDHFYPKSIYQLFSLSLWNLTPVCKPCNQLFKRQYNREILSPMESGFDDDCILKIHYQDVSSMSGINDHFTFNWEIQESAPEDKKEQIQQNLDMFSLNEIYQFHKQDIQNILRRRHLRSKLLADRQDALLGDFRLPAEDVNRLFYGTSLNKDKFHKELLGKMVYDVVVNGGGII